MLPCLQLVEILPSSLVLFILRKLPPKRELRSTILSAERVEKEKEILVKVSTSCMRKEVKNWECKGTCFLSYYLVYFGVL